MEPGINSTLLLNLYITDITKFKLFGVNGISSIKSILITLKGRIDAENSYNEPYN